MRMNYRVIVLTGISAALIAGAAQAADLPDEVTPPPAPAPVAQTANYDWSGIYAGVNLGLGFSGDFNNDLAIPLNSETGLLAGGVLGYNRQIDKFVLGIEGDINYTSLDAFNGGLDTDLNFLGTITGRVGYTPVDRLLGYVEGGYALGQIEASSAAGSDRNFHNGYVLGAGAEYALTQNILSGVEYNYVDLQDQGFGLGAAAPADIDFEGHTIKFNLKYKF